MRARQVTSIAPSVDGRLEVFVSCIKRGTTDTAELWHLYQTTPAGGWSQWVSHGAPQGVSGAVDPLVVQNAARKLELVAGFGRHDFPAAPWHISQTAPGQGWTPQWSSLGVPPGAGSVNRCAMATRHDGGLILFGVSDSGVLWKVGQATTSTDWLRWTSLGSPPPGGDLRPAVGSSADGRLEVFTVAEDGALWHIWETTLNGTWSNWTSHGKPPMSLGLNGTPVMMANSEGRLELFVKGNDFQLYHIWQVRPSEGWSDWVSHGQPPGADIFSYTPAIAASADGRLELFATGGDRALWHINQIRPSGGWSDWYSHGSPSATVGAGASPMVALNSAGQLELFVQGTNNELWHIWQTEPNRGWSGWISHGKPNGWKIFPPWYAPEAEL